ncbi:hypothetical protein CR513_02971, partial [Mucuna pruriens]
MVLGQWVLMTHDTRKVMFEDLQPKSGKYVTFVKESFKSKNVFSTSRPLELLHIDLFGPTITTFVNGKRYGLVVMDMGYVPYKHRSFRVFSIFCKRIQNEKGINITLFRSDHGGEFENKNFQQFYEDHGIFHNFLAPRTPQ